MTWTWIDDSETQGRAVCLETGLTLLAVWGSGYLYSHWRWRGVVLHEPAPCSAAEDAH